MVSSLIEVGRYNLTFKEKTGFGPLKVFIRLLLEQLYINLTDKQVVKGE